VKPKAKTRGRGRGVAAEPKKGKETDQDTKGNKTATNDNEIDQDAKGKTTGGNADKTTAKKKKQKNDNELDETTAKKKKQKNDNELDDYQDAIQYDNSDEGYASDAEKTRKRPSAAKKATQKKPATTWAGETGSATLEDNKDDDANKEDKAPDVKACDSSTNFFVMRYQTKGTVAVRCRTTKKQVLSVWALPS
jgi:hypothetical protein